MECSLSGLRKSGLCLGLLSRAILNCQRYASASTFKSNPKSHYVVLGITPTATQADIKAAYYKLTKVYHPDAQSKSEDANAQAENLQKFRQVTAAYEVLGNVKLRKLYDKGMVNVGSSGASHGMSWKPPTTEDDDPTLKFYRSRDVKSRPPPPTTNTPLYDFDEWSKQHYGATFARDQSIKRKQEFRSKAAHVTENDIKLERILIAMGVLTITIACINADLNSKDDPRVQSPVTRQTQASKT